MGGIKDPQDNAFIGKPKASPESSEIELVKVDGDAEQHDLATLLKIRNTNK